MRIHMPYFSKTTFFRAGLLWLLGTQSYTQAQLPENQGDAGGIRILSMPDDPNWVDEFSGTLLDFRDPNNPPLDQLAELGIDYDMLVRSAYGNTGAEAIGRISTGKSKVLASAKGDIDALKVLLESRASSPLWQEIIETYATVMSDSAMGNHEKSKALAHILAIFPNDTSDIDIMEFRKGVSIQYQTVEQDIRKLTALALTEVSFPIKQISITSKVMTRILRHLQLKAKGKPSEEFNDNVDQIRLLVSQYRDPELIGEIIRVYLYSGRFYMAYHLVYAINESWQIDIVEAIPTICADSMILFGHYTSLDSIFDTVWRHAETSEVKDNIQKIANNIKQYIEDMFTFSDNTAYLADDSRLLWGRPLRPVETLDIFLSDPYSLIEKHQINEFFDDIKLLASDPNINEHPDILEALMSFREAHASNTYPLTEIDKYQQLGHHIHQLDHTRVNLYFKMLGYLNEYLGAFYMKANAPEEAVRHLLEAYKIGRFDTPNLRFAYLKNMSQMLQQLNRDDDAFAMVRGEVKILLETHKAGLLELYKELQKSVLEKNLVANLYSLMPDLHSVDAELLTELLDKDSDEYAEIIARHQEMLAAVPYLNRWLSLHLAIYGLLGTITGSTIAFFILKAWKNLTENAMLYKYYHESLRLFFSETEGLRKEKYNDFIEFKHTAAIVVLSPELFFYALRYFKLRNFSHYEINTQDFITHMGKEMNISLASNKVSSLFTKKLIDLNNAFTSFADIFSETIIVELENGKKSQIAFDNKIQRQLLKTLFEHMLAGVRFKKRPILKAGFLSSSVNMNKLTTNLRGIIESYKKAKVDFMTKPKRRENTPKPPVQEAQPSLPLPDNEEVIRQLRSDIDKIYANHQSKAENVFEVEKFNVLLGRAETIRNSHDSLKPFHDKFVSKHQMMLALVKEEESLLDDYEKLSSAGLPNKIDSLDETNAIEALSIAKQNLLKIEKSLSTNREKFKDIPKAVLASYDTLIKKSDELESVASAIKNKAKPEPKRLPPKVQGPRPKRIPPKKAPPKANRQPVVTRQPVERIIGPLAYEMQDIADSPYLASMHRALTNVFDVLERTSGFDEFMPLMLAINNNQNTVEKALGRRITAETFMQIIQFDCLLNAWLRYFNSLLGLLRSTYMPPNIFNEDTIRQTRDILAHCSVIELKDKSGLFEFSRQYYDIFIKVQTKFMNNELQDIKPVNLENNFFIRDLNSNEALSEHYRVHILRKLINKLEAYEPILHHILDKLQTDHGAHDTTMLHAATRQIIMQIDEQLDNLPHNKYRIPNRDVFSQRRNQEAHNIMTLDATMIYNLISDAKVIKQLLPEPVAKASKRRMNPHAFYQPTDIRETIPPLATPKSSFA